MPGGNSRTRLSKAASRSLASAGHLAHNASRRLAETRGGETLEGDRWIEWSFCASRLADGPGKTLDFGAADVAFLSLAAAQRGHEVVAFDRMKSSLGFVHPLVVAEQGDILERPLSGQRFDQILNCSSVEHVGLAGRYGNPDRPDGDLEAMRILRDMLAPEGRHILTVPVGRDMVCAPHHRIYGEERLPQLLGGYRSIEEQYWVKDGGRWREGTRAEALATPGGEAFYSLGLFVLAPDS